MLLFLLVLLATAAHGNPFKPLFSWNKFDYIFPNDSLKNDVLESGKWSQQHTVPAGLNVWGDRLFLTIPRFKPGVLTTVNYIDLHKADSGSVGYLTPYPSWELNDVTRPNGLVSFFRMSIDGCGRMWGIDNGIDDVLGKAERLGPTRLIAIDLETDKIIVQYTLKDSDVKQGSLFSNTIIDVDPNHCDDAYVYNADCGAFGLVVYSLADNDSWRVEHNYFFPDPLNGQYNNFGINYQWHDGLFSMILTPPDQDGSKTMHFHPLCGVHQFRVPTSLLKNQTALKDRYAFRKYRIDGYKGPDTQTATAVFDPVDEIVYYTTLMKNEVSCWDINEELTPETFRTVAHDDVELALPSDIVIEPETGTVYCLSNKLPVMFYEKYDFEEANFHVVYASLEDLKRTCRRISN